MDTSTPGEVSAEGGHGIRMRLAKEIMGGKYEFVLTTHIDKGHIHNHLIFPAVSFIDYKYFHFNRRNCCQIYRVSDWLCREHELFAIFTDPDGKTLHPKNCLKVEYQAPAGGENMTPSGLLRR